MKIILIYSSLVLLLFFTPGFASAQENQPLYQYKDKIVLKSNQILFGQIIDYNEYSIILEMKSGSQVKFLISQIKKVEQYTANEEIKYEHNGHYLAVGSGLMFGNQDEESSQSKGFEISVLYKYFNPKGHVFLAGAGLESYNVDIPFLHLPLFVGYEYHLPFSPKNSIYLSIRTGYALVSSEEISNSRIYKAGWLLNPTLGLLFKINSRVGVFAETGFKFQHANHTFNQSWLRIIEEGQINRRSILRIGMIF